MAGVLFFSRPESNARGYEGLFWQMTWPNWYKLFPMVALTMGSVNINAAEFLAMLITCETFTPFCAGKITDIDTDNVSAKSWLNNARCPVYPFDRCAQGLHLHLLRHSMYLRAVWISTGENTVADRCSRMSFPRTPSIRCISERRLMKVTPKWTNVTRYLR